MDFGIDIVEIFKKIHGDKLRVYVTEKEAAALDMYGVRRFPDGAGDLEVTKEEAAELIDRAARLSVNAPKRLRKHFRCFIGSMASAGGPEFYEKNYKEVPK